MDAASILFTGFSFASISGVVAAIVNYGEMKEFKKNTVTTIDKNYKLLKDEIDSHEERDVKRQEEVINRMDRMEDTLIEVIKKSK